MDLANYTTPELFKLHHKVLAELRRREHIRSGNNIVSDYAESITCKALGLTQVRQSTRGYDALDANRQTYQIKARMISSGRGSRQLGAIRGLDRDPSPFDSLVGILFDEHHNVVRAAKIPVHVVRNRAKYQEHTNSWIFMLKDDVWREPTVMDITRELRAAAAN